jgi:hypothetical protein
MLRKKAKKYKKKRPRFANEEEPRPYSRGIGRFSPFAAGAAPGAGNAFFGKKCLRRRVF